METCNNHRLVYATSAVVVMVLGLASRQFNQQLPRFLSEYAGDTLWALMLFLVVSTLSANRPLKMRATISLVVAFSVELSQLYQAPWIASIREMTLGGLVLGFGFLWSDLVCYSAGIAFGSCIDWGTRNVLSRPKPNS